MSNAITELLETAHARANKTGKRVHLVNVKSGFNVRGELDLMTDDDLIPSAEILETVEPICANT